MASETKDGFFLEALQAGKSLDEAERIWLAALAGGFSPTHILAGLLESERRREAGLCVSCGQGLPPQETPGDTGGTT